jgi:hypothetical protein
MTWVAVGTAAAVGAGVGAGSQIIQGKDGDDILKGALIGGATGALTGGAGAAFGGGAGGASSSLTTEAASQLAPELTQAAATNIAPEIVGQTATNIVPEVAGQGITQIPQGFTAAEINAINMGNADALAASSNQFAPLASGPVGSDAAVTPLVQTPPQVSPQLIDVPPGTPFEPSSAAQSNLISEPPMNQFQGSMTRPELAEMTKAEVGSNPFMEGFNSATEWIDKNPFKSAVLGYTALSMTGALNQPTGQATPEQKRTYRGQYTLSPNFQGGPYSQPNVYRPTYASGGIISLQGGGGPVERMTAMNTAINPQGGLYPQGMIDKTQYATPTQRPASLEMLETEPSYQRSNPLVTAAGMAKGGIASFAKGTPRERDSYGEFQRYQAMMEGKKPTAPDEPAWVRSVGIMEDTDPDTKYQDALTATLIRQGKIGKRANTGSPVMARPTPMGTLNFSAPGTQQAASGGIMGYNLGGYADGGNPRLLKGPGDGMSDNIPAVIGRRQPARLADGEFVVPADVVSHLGNGSTDAGAKKLHEMMDKVRMARTGKKKQAPAVKPKKYMPA